MANLFVCILRSLRCDQNLEEQKMNLGQFRKLVEGLADSVEITWRGPEGEAIVAASTPVVVDARRYKLRAIAPQHRVKTLYLDLSLGSDAIEEGEADLNFDGYDRDETCTIIVAE